MRRTSRAGAATSPPLPSSSIDIALPSIPFSPTVANQEFDEMCENRDQNISQENTKSRQQQKTTKAPAFFLVPFRVIFMAPPLLPSAEWQYSSMEIGWLHTPAFNGVRGRATRCRPQAQRPALTCCPTVSLLHKVLSFSSSPFSSLAARSASPYRPLVFPSACACPLG